MHLSLDHIIDKRRHLQPCHIPQLYLAPTSRSRLQLFPHFGHRRQVEQHLHHRIQPAQGGRRHNKRPQILPLGKRKVPSGRQPRSIHRRCKAQEEGARMGSKSPDSGAYSCSWSQEARREVIPPSSLLHLQSKAISPHFFRPFSSVQ